MPQLLPDQWLDCELETLAQLAPIQCLDLPAVADAGLTLAVKREDQLHGHLGGNKLYKLHGHLQAARMAGHGHLLSFGGAWSNHIHALAAAGQSLGLKTTGVIRGERPAVLNAMLCGAEAMGMHLHFVSRGDYGRKHSAEFLTELQHKFGPCHVIPEGGGDLIGARGAVAWGRGLAELWQDEPFDVLCSAAGTGSTLAGLVVGLPAQVSVYGFSVLKGEGNLARDVEEQVRALGGRGANWTLEIGYHCGGYARYPRYLADFIRDFEAQTHVPLDPVYTAKMMWGLVQKARAGHWSEGTRILALHSGGLQGRRGFPLDFPA
jgi:1-aminocyclopropane-1-carboxylate deaminase